MKSQRTLQAHFIFCKRVPIAIGTNEENNKKSLYSPTHKIY